MKTTCTNAIVYLAGLALVAGAVAVSVELAGRISLRHEAGRARAMADEVMHRSEETTQQIEAALGTLGAARHAPCSDAAVGMMRKLAVSASYLQGVGRIEHGRLACSSLGRHAPPIALAPPDYVSDAGVGVRVNVRLPFAPQARFVVAELGGYAAVVHPELVFDVADYTDDASLAVVGTSTLRPIAVRGRFDARWIRPAGADGYQTRVDAGELVVMRRSARRHFIAVAAIPMQSVNALTFRLLGWMVPAGAVAGVLLAAALQFLVRRHASLPSRLRAALQRDELHLAYQPIVRLADGQCIGAEALLRWRRPDGGMERPDVFIPAAERAGLIARVTRRVLSLAEQDLPAMVAAFPQLHVSLNLSSRDLESLAIVDQLGQLISASGILPGNLHVEATERSLMDQELATHVIARIRAAGISVAIDDFGTGYSCLSYLTSLDVDYLKIDKAFVDTIGTASRASSVLPHIIEMARSLNLVLVAEGVETQAQANYLLERGVQFAQGWLYAKALEPDAFVQYLRKQIETRPDWRAASCPPPPTRQAA